MRRNHTHKSVIAKELVERGAAHQSKKKMIPAKQFIGQMICKCIDIKKSIVSCSDKIGIDRQKEIFDTYYQKMCWTQKTLFIRGSVKRAPVKTKKSDAYPIIPTKSKKFNQTYSLLDENGVEHVVCRDFFLTCLQVTPSRVFNALKTLDKNPSANEKRGKNAPANKTSDEKKNGVRQFIDSIPKYESHYCRSSSSKKYLHHALNLKKLYAEYKSTYSDRNQPFVTESIFREIFNTEYNLSFKRRHTDTCRTCDEFQVGLKSALVTTMRKDEIRQSHELHLKLVEKTKTDFQNDVKRAVESDGKIIVLTFDLQKTLETPSLSTSVAFYKRQLWTYNLCIYDEGAKRAYMYIWSENVASRGGQEIGSCLLKHLKEFGTVANEIVLWSDSCGGQNRNIKVTMLLKKYLHDLTPEQSPEVIKQKYFVSGHSYNSCDRCFGMIEKKRKVSTEIYTPNHWIDLIRDTKKSSPQFHVTIMRENDFVSSMELQSVIVNRKKNIEGNKINWFEFRSLTYRKNEPYFLSFACEDEKEQKINIKKKKSTDESFTNCDLPTLHPGGKTISKPKFDDLMQLMKFVPPEQHDFFNSLKYECHAEDYGLASDISDD